MSSSKLRYMVRISWVKPEQQVIKLNVDGSVKSHNGVAVAGGLIHNNRGNWLMGFIYKVGVTF
ncbi:hypothetical protein REPUB_Repub04eG0170500 [Reevesia pubescens]